MRFASCFLLLGLACGDSHTPDDGGTDAGRDTGVDSGVDAGVDSSVDSGIDTGDDAGSPSCEHHTDCTLLPVSCCGDCGAYTRDDIQSIHDDLVEADRLAACMGGACPPCFTEPDPALHATCEAGACDILDLYDPDMDFRSEFTECTDDADCLLRVVDCCPCGAEVRPGRLVAIRADKLAEFADIVCEPGTACDDCEPTYEPYFTRCGGDTPTMPRRCQVDVVGP